MIVSEVHLLGVPERCHTSRFLTEKSLRIQGLALWRQPHQPHPGTQCSRCGCCLPALTRWHASMFGNRCGSYGVRASGFWGCRISTVRTPCTCSQHSGAWSALFHPAVPLWCSTHGLHRPSPVRLLPEHPIAEASVSEPSHPAYVPELARATERIILGRLVGRTSAQPPD